jgi:putative redox protein
MKFASVHIIYRFDGSVDATKAKRYILASLESNSTTVNSIRDSVKVYYTIEYNGEKIADKASILSGGGSGGEAIIEDGFGGACCS